MNIVIARITKTGAISLVFVLFVGILNVIISPSSFVIEEVQAQNGEESEKEKCISYNKSEKSISITCKYANFADVTRLIIDAKSSASVDVTSF